MLEFYQIKSDVSIIVLCETWNNSDEVDLYRIEGYNTFRCCNDTYSNQYQNRIKSFVMNEIYFMVYKKIKLIE